MAAVRRLANGVADVAASFALLSWYGPCRAGPAILMMSTPLPMAVAVLGRAPELGKVKQRLAAAVGDEQALRVYRALLERTLQTCSASGLPVWFFATSEENKEVKALAHRYQCRLSRQREGDLGERMAHAFAQVHDHARQVVLVGTDCPALNPADLWQLCGAVGSGGAALIAAEDGGYVAIASGNGRLWQQQPPFDGVAWGSETALTDTVKWLRRYEEKVTICATKWDLDTPADLARARQAGLITSGG